MVRRAERKNKKKIQRKKRVVIATLVTKAQGYFF